MNKMLRHKRQFHLALQREIKTQAPWDQTQSRQLTAAYSCKSIVFNEQKTPQYNALLVTHTPFNLSVSRTVPIRLIQIATPLFIDAMHCLMSISLGLFNRSHQRRIAEYAWLLLIMFDRRVVKRAFNSIMILYLPLQTENHLYTRIFCTHSGNRSYLE